MNILLIALYFPPDSNGVSARAYNCAKALALQGCKVTVVSAFPTYPNGLRSPKYKNKVIYSEEIEGIKVIRTWVPNLPHFPINRRIIIYFSFMLSSLLGLMFCKHVEIILSMNPSFFAFFPSFFYSIICRKKIIRNVDDLWPEVFYDMGIVRSMIVKKVLNRLASISYRIPKMIVPVSRGYVETLTDKYHIPLNKIVVIEHGVDVHRFKPNPLRESNDANSKKLIIYSGHISEAYDFELVVQAAKILTTEHVHFIIRGTGPLTEKVKSMADMHRIFNVEVKTDVLSQDDLVSFLNRADIFILPMTLTRFGASADKGLPTKTLEYQALGRPIICISAGEPARYIVETSSGLVSSRRDPKELAELIKRLINDQNLSYSLGMNGLRHVDNNLTLEMIGRRFMNVIYSVLHKQN